MCLGNRIQFLSELSCLPLQCVPLPDLCWTFWLPDSYCSLTLHSPFIFGYQTWLTFRLTQFLDPIHPKIPLISFNTESGCLQPGMTERQRGKCSYLFSDSCIMGTCLVSPEEVTGKGGLQCLLCFRREDEESFTYPSHGLLEL